jgi:hypothetical protein
VKGDFHDYVRGNLSRALPGLIADLKRGHISLTKIANKNGIDRRTLSNGLRKGEAAGEGLLFELHQAELSSRARRPWGCKSGRGKSFPKPSAQTLAERAKHPGWSKLDTVLFGRDPGSDSDEDQASDESGTDSASAEGGNGVGLHYYSDTFEIDSSEPVSAGGAEGSAAAGSSPHMRAPQSTKRKPGRPGTLTPELIATIATAVHYGSSRADTAAGVGIPPRRISKWLARGKRETETIYAQFYLRVMSARGRRCKPASLVEIKGWSSDRGNARPDLEQVETLRKLTRVLFMRAPKSPDLVELRWPRASRKPSAAQRQLLNDGLRVLARDADHQLRSIIFLAAAPQARSKRKAASGEVGRGRSGSRA